ncbi:hypothetical protein BDF14DRAFT_1856767 [Spinellus fusiger]|nr:hypothetical protein BDF14DRAFT_1856767 [Spinellus fusiger]
MPLAAKSSWTTLYLHTPLSKSYMHTSANGFTSNRHPAKKNPFEILGLSTTASQEDIKKAYYNLAKQYHPDTNKTKQAHERFVQIQEAYQFLLNQDKREYFQSQGFDKRSTSNSSTDPRNHGHPFYGGGFQGAPQPTTSFRIRRGEDRQVPLTISFKEAAKGTTKTVMVDQVTHCSFCSGSGVQSGKQKEHCTLCQGTGTQNVTGGGFHHPSTCPTCHGEGTFIPVGSQCTVCHGIGKVKKAKAVEVVVEAGVENRARLRVLGQGDVPMQGHGSQGDLFVSIHVSWIEDKDISHGLYFSIFYYDDDSYHFTIINNKESLLQLYLSLSFLFSFSFSFSFLDSFLPSISKTRRRYFCGCPCPILHCYSWWRDQSTNPRWRGELDTSCWITAQCYTSYAWQRNSAQGTSSRRPDCNFKSGAARVSSIGNSSK